VNKEEAIITLQKMERKRFNRFVAGLPPYIQIRLKGGQTDWKELLLPFYLKNKGLIDSDTDT